MRRSDVLVIGAGMGGMAAASLLSKEGLDVTVLEAAHLPGGCSSSYKKRGGVFETGATTLMGFDPGQPLDILQKKLGIQLPITPLEPSMMIDMDGGRLTRYRDLDRWIEECVREFGQPDEQKRFWTLAKRISDTVWKVSSSNRFFPPLKAADWLMLLRNDPRDVWILPYAMHSVRQQCVSMGLTHPGFLRMLDEQLLISAQSGTSDTSMLFGAPALTYTNYTNGYVEGGLLEMIRALQACLESNGGELVVRRKVVSIEQEGASGATGVVGGSGVAGFAGARGVTGRGRASSGGYILRTDKGDVWQARWVVSNITVWDMPSITAGPMRTWFERHAARYDKAWGAMTFGLLVTDTFDDSEPLHRQIHLPVGCRIPGAESGSMFVSMSMRGDLKRAPEGHRTLNISLHVRPEEWFGLGEAYDRMKADASEEVLNVLRDRVAGFASCHVKEFFPATPITWKRWVHRHRGRVGGIPQSMERSLLDWTPAETPFPGLLLCGDTVYPGQGIPGVTLSGINVYSRIMRAIRR